MILHAETYLSELQCMNVLGRDGKVGGRAKDIGVRLIARYNLLVVPVANDQGQMLGIVSVDDVIDAVLPTRWKKRLPRMFPRARGG